jgi:hypothetical protein
LEFFDDMFGNKNILNLSVLIKCVCIKQIN